MIGCAMFLISGPPRAAEVCHGRLCLRRRDLGWWIAALNQLGSYLFLVSALAAFVNPETSSAVNEAVANWGTFGGALCFAVGGVLQAFERPAVAPGSDDAATQRSEIVPASHERKVSDMTKNSHLDELASRFGNKFVVRGRSRPPAARVGHARRGRNAADRARARARRRPRAQPRDVRDDLDGARGAAR